MPSFSSLYHFSLQMVSWFVAFSLALGLMVVKSTVRDESVLFSWVVFFSSAFVLVLVVVVVVTVMVVEVMIWIGHHLPLMPHTLLIF